MPFQKGISGNPGGKPKGTSNHDRINYLDLQIWFKKMYETLDDIDKPEARMSFQLQVADKLLSKISNLPSSPQVSLENAKARQELINALEAGPKEPNENPVETDGLAPHA